MKSSWTVIAGFFAGSCLQVSLFANSYDNITIDEYFDFLASSNAISSLEGGGAYGAYGVSVGIGGYVGEGDNAIVNDRFAKNPNSGDKVILPRVFLSKGILYPLDIGLNYGTAGVGEGKILGVYGQLTVLEKLKFPAVAIQAGWSELTGVETTRINSQSLGLIVSYGFLNYFTLLGEIKNSKHSASLSLEPDESQTFLNLSSTTRETYEQNWTETSYSYGLKTVLLPPFISVSLMARVSDSERRDFLFKLSYGL